MLKNKFLSFIFFLTITFSASFIGAFITINYKEPWYSQIIKSNYNPPDWVFAPVWTSLYLTMTFAIWIFWHCKNKDTNTIYIYFLHIIVNTTWSIVFFWFSSNFFSNDCFGDLNFFNNCSYFEVYKCQFSELLSNDSIFTLV